MLPGWTYSVLQTDGKCDTLFLRRALFAHFHYEDYRYLKKLSLNEMLDYIETHKEGKVEVTHLHK